MKGSKMAGATNVEAVSSVAGAANILKNTALRSLPLEVGEVATAATSEAVANAAVTSRLLPRSQKRRWPQTPFKREQMRALRSQAWRLRSQVPLRWS